MDSLYIRMQRISLPAIKAAVFALTSFSALVLLALFHRVLSRHDTRVSTFPSGSHFALVLPFTIPCALSSGDAEPIFGALKNHNRTALETFSLQRRMLAVEKGSSVIMWNFADIAAVKVKGGPQSGAVCFVPSWIVGSIRAHPSAGQKQ